MLYMGSFDKKICSCLYLSLFDETLTNQVCHNRASNTKPNACEMNAAAEVVGEEGNDLATHEVERKKP